jgi:hypothetical protein
VPDFPGFPETERLARTTYPAFWSRAAKCIRFGVMSLSDMEDTLPADRKTIRRHMAAMGFSECGNPRRVEYRRADAEAYAIWLANPKVPSPHVPEYAEKRR